MSKQDNLGWSMLLAVAIPIAMLYLLLRFIAKGIAVIVRIIIDAAPKKTFPRAEIAADQPITMTQLDALDKAEFSGAIARLLAQRAYTDIEQCGDDGYGVDIVAAKNGKKYAFSCQRRQDNLSIDTIYQIVQGADAYHADQAVLISNGFLSQSTCSLAQDLQVVILNRDALIKFISIAVDPVSAEAATADSGIVAAEAVPLNKQTIGADVMTTKIGAGKYVFGEDIPLGKYNLTVISGEGSLNIHHGGKNSEEWLPLGLADGFAKSYFGLSLPAGQYFVLSGDVVCEISKSRMIEI